MKYTIEVKDIDLPLSDVYGVMKYPAKGFYRVLSNPGYVMAVSSFVVSFLEIDFDLLTEKAADKIPVAQTPISDILKIIAVTQKPELAIELSKVQL
jgi:hypothetical protein